MTELLNEPEVPETQDAPQISAEDLKLSFEGLLTGIRMCLKRIAGDDVFKRRLENMIDETAQLETDTFALLNANTCEFNGLVEEFEALETSNGLLNLRVAELNKELNASADVTAAMLESERAAHHHKRTELEAEIRKGLESNEVLTAAAKILTSEKRLQKTRIDDLERMQPERLKQNNAKLKIANADLTKKNSNVNLELTRLYKAHSRLQTDLAHSEGYNAELQADLAENEHHDKLLAGEHVVDKFCILSEKNSQIAFYPYIFKWGLNVWEGEAMMEPKRRNPSDLMFIQGLDFHIQIRSTLGQDVTCKMSEFGRALYLVPTQLLEHWPVSMDALIQEYHLEQLERLSVPLYERCLWCRDQHIDTLDFVPEKLKPSLVALGLDNLMMLGAATYAEVENIKGMGDATFTKIREGCIRLLDSYADEHGEIPLTVHREHAKPPMAQRIKDGMANRLADIKLRSKAAGMEDVE